MTISAEKQREIISKVKKIEIKTHKKVNEILAGGYHSAFKGQGMEFSEVREYIPGDDIRAIDWNVTARKNYPHIKIFKEERELTVYLLVDCSLSLNWGSDYALKNELAAEIAALFAFSAANNNDNVGLMLFSDIINKHIPLGKGKKHVLRIIREVLWQEQKPRRTSLKNVLAEFNRLVKKKSLLIVISDFISEDFSRELSVTSLKHDVIPVVVNDSFEKELPDVGVIEMRDMEQQKNVLIDTSSKKVRDQYLKLFNQKNNMLNEVFKKNNSKPIHIYSNESYVDPIARYFKFREHLR